MSEEYLIAQMEAIREEILRLHGSVVRILSIGITGVPVIVGASLQLNIDPVIYISPLIVGVFILMLLFEQNSIMRAGRYIRLYIEPHINIERFIGWETFLETNRINRRAEICFAIASHATFAIYYIGGTALAFRYLLLKYDLTVALTVLCLYSGGFFVSVYLVYKNFPIGTLLPGENRPTDPLL